MSRSNILVILFFLFITPLFFYKLGQSSLVSWDEAWYAEIARNILISHDLFNLSWNGLPFSDKPPGGFWLEALSFNLFGVSEFSARLPSALAGFLSVVLIYLLANKLFGKFSGFLSAMALVSSFWFLYRARFGDLDMLLILFYLLTFYLAIKAAEKRKFFLFFCLSLAFLPLIKGIVFAVSLIPSLVIIFWGKNEIKKQYYLLPILSLFAPFGLWILIQYLHSPQLAIYHFYHSVRDSSLQNDILSSMKLFKDYLHNGIGKWFWPGVLGTALSLVLKDKKLLTLFAFVFFYSIQFLFSPSIEIWHLMPLYPFLILLFFGSCHIINQKFFKGSLLINGAVLVFALYISFTQLKTMWHQFINIPAFVSDDAILSKEAAKYPYPFYIDSSFEPAAVFYSQKQAKWQNEYDLPFLFTKNDPFLLIVKEPMLDKLKVAKKDYQILKSDRDKIIILYKPIY